MHDNTCGLCTVHCTILWLGRYLASEHAKTLLTEAASTWRTHFQLCDFRALKEIPEQQAHKPGRPSDVGFSST